MDMTFFAQGLDAVPAPFLKNLLIVALALCVGAGAFAGVAGVFRKRARTRALAAGADGEFTLAEILRRLDEHETQIGKLWETMREEDKQIRDTLARAIRDFEGATERLQGTLNEVKQTTALLLQKALENSR